jgi:hypothetical protein
MALTSEDKTASAVEFEMDLIDTEGLRNLSDPRQARCHFVRDEDTLALARSGKKQILAVS